MSLCHVTGTQNEAGKMVVAPPAGEFYSSHQLTNKDDISRLGQRRFYAEGPEASTTDVGLPVGASVGHFAATPACCTACRLPVVDEILQKVGEDVYHSDCVKCADCEADQRLGSHCYSWGRALYCYRHFYRRHGVKCSGCRSGMPPSELVRQAHNNIYHEGCFSCLSCQKQIDNGQEFHLTCDNRLVCRQCYIAMQRGKRARRPEQTTTPSTASRSQNQQKLSEYRAEYRRQLTADFRVVQVWLDSLKAKQENTKSQSTRIKETNKKSTKLRGHN